MSFRFNKKIILILVLVFALIFIFTRSSGQDESEQPSTSDEQASVEETPQSSQLAVLSGQEFKDLFDNLSLPNTTVVLNPQPITGDAEIDAVIQEIAESRGYRLQLVASSKLNKYDGVELQELLLKDWKRLKKSASEAGHNLEIRSGYRSVEEQRELFLSRYNALGLSYETVVGRQSDNQISGLLQTVSPPGYSRHHSGYTIDIADTSASVFEYSEGFRWISENNYENAKKFGFIPSYPEGVDNQGPDPEAWEYVWVNRDFILE